MLSIDELKLIKRILNGEDVDFSTLKEKINLIVEQIEISEEAQKKMSAIQDKIVKLGEENGKEEKNS